jgi:DNA-binding response OmpR family regulator
MIVATGKLSLDCDYSGHRLMGNTARLAGRTVLIVEDEPVIALELRKLFETEGANVRMASNPTDALLLLENVSAAMLDFVSRGDDIAALCRTLRGLGIPFMYYTGFDDLDERLLGAPIVTKPASAEVLVTCIERLLSLSRNTS